MSRRWKGPPPDVDYSDSLPALKAKIKEIDDFHKGSNWIRKQPDSTLHRFLKGHNGDVDRAVEKMMTGAKKRWELATDTWFEGYEKDLTAPTVLVKGHWPSGVTGRDHRGKPVVYNHLTAVDFPGLTACVGINPMLKHMVFQTETMLNEFPEGGAILVLDLGLDGLASSANEARLWTQSMFAWIKKFGAIMDCYPETYSRIIFTRAPKIFWATWKVTKNFLPERTLQKVQILSAGSGGDPMSVLLELMDTDAIPNELGGTSRVVLGTGGKIQKNAHEDDDYISQLRSHVRLMQGDFANGRQSARYSNLRTQAEESDMQEKLALELMKMQIEEAKTSNTQASQRGSWRFEPGLDVLDSVDDEALLDELRNENFDPAKALDRLKTKAAKNEGIALPEKEVQATVGGDAEGEEQDGSKCVVM